MEKSKAGVCSEGIYVDSPTPQKSCVTSASLLNSLRSLGAPVSKAGTMMAPAQAQF